MNDGVDSGIGSLATSRNRNYWFKVTGMLQQNWALIEPLTSGCVVYFFHDLKGVFDKLQFDNVLIATSALERNGFGRYQDDSRAQEYIVEPRGEFHWEEHPNGRIYSSGLYWQD